MAIRREKVTLVLDDNFTSGIRRAAETVDGFMRDLALQQATWEPHDWSDFD